MLAFLSHAQPGLDGFGAVRSSHSTAEPASAAEPANASGPAQANELARDLPLIPRFSDLAFDVSYFADVSEPLRATLVSAVQAHKQDDYAKVGQILAGADHPKALLLAAVNALAIGQRYAFENGIRQLERAIEKGEPRAMALLGVIKLRGVAAYDRDPAAGRALLERAVEAGDVAAPRMMGEGYLTGWMGAVDPARARQFLQLGSDRGDAEAAFRLGVMLMTGQGIPKDDAAAERLFAKAADAGHAEALAMRGVRALLAFGSGLTDNVDDALRWLELAAAQNQPEGFHYQAIFYMEYGRRLHRLDLPRGVALLRRCAETTLNRDCVADYANALDLGVGTERDPVRAYAMFALAYAAGSTKVQERRDALARTLSAEEIARANVIRTRMSQDAPGDWQSARLVK